MVPRGRMASLCHSLSFAVTCTTLLAPLGGDLHFHTARTQRDWVFPQVLDSNPINGELSSAAVTDAESVWC